MDSNNNITNQIKKSKDTKKSKRDFRDKYFIKDVENITGIKAFTLRIWEQRYGMLVPKRTDTNIRYYEEDDLKYMMNIALLNANGYKISRIAEMSRDEVQKCCLHLSESNTEYSTQIQQLTSAMLAFDEKEFNKNLSILILKIGMEDTMAQVIFPFLQHVGALWLSGAISIPHEHFITNIIKQRIYSAIDQINIPIKPDAKRFVLFLPNGENHELSLLFANYMLRSRGQQVFYIGSSTPFEDLVQLQNMHKPDALFCALTNASNPVPVQVYINNLSRHWPNVTICLTGNLVVKRKDLKLPKNCHIINSTDDFKVFLDLNLNRTDRLS